MYFLGDDYAPFWRRVLVDVIDLLVFAFLCTVLMFPLGMILPPGRAMLNLILLTFVAIAASYFVLLKRSTLRTLGYRLCRVRVVGLDGQAASYWSLVFRMMFGIFGPVFWLFDLTWLTTDSNRQTLHDKFANTYVVKANAQAAGQGRIVFRAYDILCYNLLFREVDPGTIK